MAKLLSTITILENFTTGQFAKGQVIKVFKSGENTVVKMTTTGGTYNLSAGQASTLPAPSEVVKKTIDKNTGEVVLSTSTLVFWSREETGYKNYQTTLQPTTSATGVQLIHSWKPSSSYPYVIKTTKTRTLKKLDQPPPPDDIRLEWVSEIKATTETAADGTLVVLATGTNTPFTYYINDPSAGATGQASGTFATLRSGNYRIYAKDNEGFQTYIDLEMQYVDVPPINANNDTIGNYGVRWRHISDNLEGDDFKIDIFQRGYTGNISTVKGAARPFEFIREADGNSFVDMNILSSSANINLIQESDDQFRDIVTADEEKFIVVRAKYNGATYDTKWIGFVTPQSYTDILYQTPYEVSIQANDRTGDLDKFKFLLGDNKSGNRIDAVLPQLHILHICLSKTKLALGYRIACNIFAEGHTTTNKSPFDQTYLDTKKYFEGEDVQDCNRVVLDLLKTYQAVLFLQDDYWYIVRKEEWLNTSISYIEYDSSLAFVASSSWSPRVNFDSPTASNRAVWLGKQTRTYTRAYSDITLDIDTGLKDNLSVTPDFLFSDTTFSSGGFQGFGRWNLFTTDDEIDRSRPLEIDDKAYWQVAVEASTNSSTYLEYNGTITYTGGDQFTIETDVLVDGYYETDDGFPFLPIPIDEYPPYIQLKWSLKLGDEWISSDNRWSTTESLNYKFFERTEQEFKFSKTLTLPSDGSTNQNFQLRVYTVDITEADFQIDYQVDSNLIVTAQNRIVAIDNAIAKIGSNSFPVKNTRKQGDRIVVGIGNEFLYYELQYKASRIDDTIDRVYCRGYDPDTLPYAWVLIRSVDLPYRDSSSGFGNQTYCTDASCRDIEESLVNVTRFSSIYFKVKTTGEPPKEKISLQKTAQALNSVDKIFEMSSFDLGTLNASLHLNYLRYSDNTPTKNWTKTGDTITKPIQRHAIIFLAKFTRTPKGKLNASYRTDGVDFTAINVLLDTSDGSKLYISTGVSSDDKLQEFNGELLEISAGDDVTPSAFSTGFKQNSFR